MTPRLDRVEYGAELILLIASRADEPIRINTLHSRLEEIDLDPFVFDEVFEETSEFVNLLRMYNRLGFLGRADHGVIGLTDRGDVLAGYLEAALTDEEQRALVDAGVTR